MNTITCEDKTILNVIALVLFPLVCSILRWRADPGRSTSERQGGGVGTGKGELEMKPNAAYETVHYAEPPVYELT